MNNISLIIHYIDIATLIKFHILGAAGLFMIIFIHECCHAIAALLVGVSFRGGGMGVISFGFATRWLPLKGWKLRQMKWLPHCRFKGVPAVGWKRNFIAAAGPSGAIVAALPAAAFVWTLPSQEWVHYPITVGFGIGVLDILNFIPFRRGRAFSDGAFIVTGFRRTRAGRHQPHFETKT